MMKKIKYYKPDCPYHSMYIPMTPERVIVVTAASVQDRDGAKLVFQALSNSCKHLRLIWADGGYRGRLLD
jgi:hypothetical protein